MVKPCVSFYLLIDIRRQHYLVLELDEDTHKSNTKPMLSQQANVGTGKDITIRELAQTMKVCSWL